MIKSIIYYLFMTFLFSLNLPTKGMDLLDLRLMTSLSRAIKTNDQNLLVDTFRATGQSGKDYRKFFDENFCTNPARTMLMYAADFGQTATVELLIQLGVNVDYKNKDGATALMFACKRGNVDIMNLLIKAGADLNAMDNKYQAVIKYAIIFDKLEAVKFLVSLGANIKQKDNKGQDALGLAISLDHSEIVKFLLRTLKTRREILKQELSDYVPTGVDQLIMEYADC